MEMANFEPKSMCILQNQLFLIFLFHLNWSIKISPNTSSLLIKIDEEGSDNMVLE